MVNSIVTQLHAGVYAYFVGFVIFIVVVAVTYVGTFLVDAFTVAAHS